MKVVELSVDYSRPAAGRSVAAVAAPLALSMSSAAKKISAQLSPQHSLSWLDRGAERDLVPNNDCCGRSGWALAALAVLHALTVGCRPDIDQALVWFGDRSTATALQHIDFDQVEEELAGVASASGAAELFPYTLDPFGPTSRLDAMRDGSRKPHRAARKNIGSFYTPSDVAEFMVSAIRGNEPNAVWFDPACGSGVFLRAALKIEIKEGRRERDLIEFAATRLLGIDISTQAADFAAFSICQQLAHSVQPDEFVEVWVQVRRNIVAADSMGVTSREAKPGALSLHDLFGEITAPLRFVCNPPYSAGFSSIRAPYLSFLDLSWQLCTRAQDNAALVLPLSVASNRDTNHCQARSRLVEAGGQWGMLFFDRQPHALFGEDAKTRAAILIRRGTGKCKVRTSGLLKWTSSRRASIFSEERAVNLADASIAKFVPKLGNEDEVELYNLLTRYKLRRPTRPALRAIAPASVRSASEPKRLFVGSTAYNFINVFRGYTEENSQLHPLSDSKVHMLDFASEDDARVGFALLSSTIAFWLWHVEGDGFHLTSWFLKELPLFDLNFERIDKERLSELGNHMWLEAQNNMVASNNGGKWTTSYSLNPNCPARTSVDSMILRALHAKSGILEAVREFNFRATSIDGKHRSARAQLQSSETKKVLAL